MANEIENKLGKIAIIGAGPAGLTLSRILQINGIDVKVYEGESSIDVRSQGGTLDLHVESGQFALRQAQLFDQFLNFCRPEGQDTRIMNKFGEILFEDISSDTNYDRPEIDRGDLRQLLLNSLKPQTIVQGYSLKTIQQIENGQYELRFENDQIEYADFVVGADGAWSRVRCLLTDERPEYSGLTMIEVELTNVDQRYPNIGQLVGRGSLMALDDGKGLIAQRNSQHRICLYICLTVEENWINELNIPLDQIEEIRSFLINLFSDWNSSLVDLIRCCDPKLTHRKISMLKIDHRWKNRSGVTLIGDAAHLMSPFAGEGVNLAMIDANDLASVIIQSNDLSNELIEFEEKMFDRAHRAARESKSNLEMMMSKGDSAKKTAEFFEMLMSEGAPSSISSAKSTIENED